MSYCQICGTEDRVAYRARSGMTLCSYCHAETPEKVSFAEFCLGYFDTAADNLTGGNYRLALEFFSDYCTSTYGAVADYRAATTSVAY